MTKNRPPTSSSQEISWRIEARNGGQVHLDHSQLPRGDLVIIADGTNSTVQVFGSNSFQSRKVGSEKHRTIMMTASIVAHFVNSCALLMS